MVTKECRQRDTTYYFLGISQQNGGFCSRSHQGTDTTETSTTFFPRCRVKQDCETIGAVCM
jgi:hypothetical protein